MSRSKNKQKSSKIFDWCVSVFYVYLTETKRKKGDLSPEMEDKSGLESPKIIRKQNNLSKFWQHIFTCEGVTPEIFSSSSFLLKKDDYQLSQKHKVIQPSNILVFFALIKA